MEKLHPNAKWFFRFKVFSVLLSLGFIFLPLLIISFIFKKVGLHFYLPFLQGSGIFILIFIILFFLLSELFVQLSYNNWKYELTDKELKIERGIFTKTFKSLPYDRMQNIDIRRGVLARIFNFSSLFIQTAGYSRGIPEGYLPAVSVKRAEEIRNFLIKKISHNKSGL